MIMAEKKKCQIFISHSTKDKDIIECFVEKILVLGCGLNENNVFCTSIDGLGIKNGVDFRSHIRSNLKSADFVFIMVSSNYKKSEICLNEMGAAWADENVKIKQFLFPDLDFDSLGVLLEPTQAGKLEKSASLDEIYDEFADFSDKKKNTTRWNKHKSDFLEKLNKILCSSMPLDEYAQLYLQEDININKLFLDAQPTLLDCEKIFKREYSKQAFDLYESLFASKFKNSTESFYPNKKFFKTTKLPESDISTHKCLNENIAFYSICFLENEYDDAGMIFRYFCCINGRWVFTPKPWHLIKEKT